MHPQAEQKSIFRTLLLGRGDLEIYLVDLDGLLRVTTKKVVNFFEEKVHPRQNPGYAYAHSDCVCDSVVTDSKSATESAEDSVARGVGSGDGHRSPSPAWRSGGNAPRKFFEISVAKSRILTHFAKWHH